MRFRAPLAVLALVAVPVACAKSTVTPAPAAEPCRVTVGKDPAFDLLLDGAGGCTGSVRMSLRVAMGSASAPVWSAAATGPVRIEGTWELASTGAARTVVAHNVSTEAIDLVGLEWTANELPAKVDRMFHDGYQSWSYAGIEAIPPSLPERAGTAPQGGADGDELGEVQGVSWWVGALTDATGNGLVAGADGATVLKTYVAADGQRMRLVEGMTGDVVRLAAGESRTLDGLFLHRGDVRAGLDEYAKHVAARHPRAARTAQKPLGGWGSWNLYYEKISADVLRPEIAWAADRLAPLGLSTFLTDDGYEPHWGAWSAKSAFGVELGAYATEQTARGLVPAIWLAPIYVDTTDAAFTKHPDWFVGKSDGSGARTYAQPGGSVKAALDITHPDARVFAVSQLRQLWEWGYRVFKLDFLFGAALEGHRREPITSMESYARWMRAIREAVPEAHLIGCGAPVLASVGFFDSMRTGPDIAFSGAPEPYYGYLAAQARNTALRAFTDAWWSLDPDVVLLRGARISDDDAWSAVVLAALAGGNYLLGDGRQAGELRVAMALDPEILGMARDGHAARAEDLAVEMDSRVIASPVLGGVGETAIPHVWRKTSTDGRRRWTAVFGWLADPFAADVAFPDGAVEILPPTPSGPAKTRPITSGLQRVEVAPHAVRLFRQVP
jgi:alpha-galactosidase